MACQGPSDYLYGVKIGSTDTSEAYQVDKPILTARGKRGKEGFVYVTKVIDGDTFWVDDGMELFKVRFIGIDAPEIRNTRWKKKGYYANESKKYVQSKTEHQWVRLEYDIQSTDQYRRTLAYIYLKDGTFLNASLLEQGYVVVTTFPPNVKYVGEFIKLQNRAREKKRGLWGRTLK
ncbi:MAG: thermonuclease family protein [Sphingobacterium sp.]